MSPTTTRHQHTMSKTPLQEALVKAQDEVLQLKQRYFAFRAFVDDLERVSQDEEYAIRNTVVWTALLDSRDMLVIHLADWCRAALNSGGLLGKVGASLNELPRRWPNSRRDPTHGSPFNSEIEKGHDDAFGRLFPAAKGKCAEPGDVDKLKERWTNLIKDLKADRDQNRAHYYSQRQKESGKATAKMLSLEDFKRLFDDVQRILRDLSIVVGGGSLMDNDLQYPDSKVAASDLVDLLLLGTIHNIPRWHDIDNKRQLFYDQLRAAFHTQPPAPDDLQNERWFNSPKRVRLFKEQRGALGSHSPR